MEFTVAKSDLARELVYAGGCAETKVTLPHLGTFLLEAQGDTLRITSTDLAVGYTSAIPAIVKEEGRISIDARVFSSYVSSLPDSSIHIKTIGVDNDRILATCGRNKTRIAIMSPDNFPALPVANESTAYVSSAVLGELVNKVIFSMGDEPRHDRAIVNGIHFNLTEDGITLTATTIRTLATVDHVSSLEGKPVQFVLSKRGATELRRLLSDFAVDRQVGITCTDKHVGFSWDNRLLTSTIQVGKFPTYKPSGLPLQAVIPAASLKDVLGRVSSFAADVSHKVNMTFGANELTVSSTGGFTGEGEEPIDVEYTGDPVTIAINGAWPREFLKRVGEANIIFKFSPTTTEWNVDGDSTYRYYVSAMV